MLFSTFRRLSSSNLRVVGSNPSLKFKLRLTNLTTTHSGCGSLTYHSEYIQHKPERMTNNRDLADTVLQDSQWNGTLRPVELPTSRTPGFFRGAAFRGAHIPTQDLSMPHRSRSHHRIAIALLFTPLVTPSLASENRVCKRCESRAEPD